MRLTQLLGFVIATSFLQAATAADWAVTDEVDAVLKVPACRALTKVNKSNAPAEIVVAVPKDKALLPIVYLSYTGLPTQSLMAQIRFAKKEFQPTYLLSEMQTAGEPDLYWYAPKELSRLFELMKKSATLDTVFDPKAATPITVRFSLAGVSAALKKLATCSDRKELIPTEFLKALNQQVSLDGSIAQASVSQVLALTNATYADYLNGKTIASSLAELRKAMKPLADKEAKALKTQTTKQTAVDATTAGIQKNQTETVRLEAEVVRATEDLSAARAQLPEAKSDLANKKAGYESARATLSALENDIRRRASVLEESSNAVARARNDISRYQSHLRNLEDEVSRLRYQISNLENELSSARSEESSARAALGVFRPREEVEAALRSDWRYNSLKQSLHQKHEEQRRAHSELEHARGRLGRAQSELHSCRSRDSLHDSGNGVVRGPRHGNGRGNGRGNGLTSSECAAATRAVQSAHANLQQATAILMNVGRICGGAPACIVTAQNNYNNAVNAVQSAEAAKARACAGEPPRPTPTPRPPPDCRRQEEAVRHAQHEVDRAESHLSSIRNEIESTRSQVHAIESEVRSRVASRHAELRLRYDNAVARINAILQDIESAQARAGRITGEEIPRYEDALANATARLPDLVDREAAAERALESARRRLAEKRQEIGWGSIEAAYGQAKRLVNQLEEQISTLGVAITRNTGKVAKLKTQLPKLQQTLEKQNQELSAAQAGVVAIQTQLAPQRQQEAAIVAQLDAAKLAFAEKCASYQASIKKLNEGL